MSVRWAVHLPEWRAHPEHGEWETRWIQRLGTREQARLVSMRSGQDRQRSLLGLLLVGRFARLHLGLGLGVGVDGGEALDVGREPGHGRPYLVHAPQASFNLSHDGEWVVLVALVPWSALSKDGDATVGAAHRGVMPRRVGVDVVQLPPSLPPGCGRSNPGEPFAPYVHPVEWAAILHGKLPPNLGLRPAGQPGSAPSPLHPVYAWWAVKEATCKMLGLGLTGTGLPGSPSPKQLCLTGCGVFLLHAGPGAVGIPQPWHLASLDWLDAEHVVAVVQDAPPPAPGDRPPLPSAASFSRIHPELLMHELYSS